jgi:hypothetical protein
MKRCFSSDGELAPHSKDSHAKTLDYFTSYVQSYFDEGGMQWQFNLVTTDTLRDAMKKPEDYHWLLVRISGYNAFFTKINEHSPSACGGECSFLNRILLPLNPVGKSSRRNDGG